MPDRSTIDWPSWTQSPPGRYILAWEQAQLDQTVSNLFGYHALQLGLPQLDALRENRMSCRGLVLDATNATLPPKGCPSRATVWCDLLDLPFETQSVDLLVMPHTLEFTSDPHRLLREAERVLMPEGQLIILGFNSLSLWGMRQTFSKMSKHPFVPSTPNLIAFTRLKDWIKLLGFELERGRFGCYRPPLTSDAWLARYAFMEAAGDRWWPIFGALYLVTAIKRVRGMRLVGLLQKTKPVLAPGLAPAATQTSTHPQHDA